MPQIPTARRLQLGRELRRLREEAGITRDRVAAELDGDLSKVSRIETGKQGLSVAEVRLLLGMYGVAKEEAERIVEIAREARKRSPLRVPDYVKTFVGFEAEADEIRKFEVELVPGLLQTQDYTRAVTRAVDPAGDPAEVERLVALRAERQKRLLGPHPPQLWAVMTEAVVRHVVGGRAVMREQLERLVELAQLPNVSMQIVPFSAGAHAAMGNSFSILRLPEPPGARVVYLEDLWSADYIDKGPQLDAYSRVFDLLCASALDAKGTIDMIEEVIGDLR
jgi:transcriptional regulator with XRE-family HTH domain